MNMKLGSHLSKRIKERMGIPKRGHKRLLKNFLKRGLTIEEVATEKKDRKLYLFLCSLQKEGCELRYYNNHVLIYNPETNEGITVLKIPNLNKTGGKKDATESHKNVKRRIRQVPQTCPGLGPIWWSPKVRRKWKRRLRRRSESFDDPS